MGTVGLSFGSPTSGTGFNVSSTVSEIVGNMQQVETPWKSQLTALQSQDTVISNLGTLFSTLSTDLNTLTEFNGTLAQKEGSSSNTNVLELTAADSTATAGTHTVVVQNLAQTSSGYLDAIANSSDTLSGSLSIQVGNGTTENIVIGAAPSSPAANTLYTGTGVNTLAGLASAINAAGFGVSANVLADASGARLSLVSNTSGAAGQMTIASSLTDANNVTSTNTTGTLNYNATTKGLNASLQIDGVPLSSASNTVSNLIPGVTFQLLSASSQLSDGSYEPVQVVIGNNNSGVETAVNQFVTDYNALINAITAQEGNDSSGNAEPLFGSPTISLLQQELYSGLNDQNPNGYLDAISNSSDTLSGSITIQVGSGTAQTIDVPSSDATLGGLASAINAANIGVTANVVTNSSGSQLILNSMQVGSSGGLTVNSSLTDSTTDTPLNYNNANSDIRSLTALGVSMNSDGTLTFDANTLDSLLNSDYNSVAGFFQNANSWGQTFATMLSNAGTSSSSGILKLAQNANSSIESQLNAEITKEDSYIAAQQAELTTELNNANQILEELPTQLTGINELYSAITGYNQNTNG